MMQLSINEEYIEKAILNLEDHGWRFRVTRWKDRETIISHTGQQDHVTKTLHRYVRENKKLAIEYLDRRAKRCIAVCRQRINNC